MSKTEYIKEIWNLVFNGNNNMQINGFHFSGYENKTNPQSYSLEQKIERLEEQKRKIQQDLNKKSNNPDPKAAIGDNLANSAVNRKILEKIESQINILESRKNSSAHNDNISEINNKAKNQPDNPGKNIDILA